MHPHPAANIATDTATDLDRLVRRRVKARLGWITHALVWLAVMGGLTALALWQGRQPPVAAALGWGLGLAIHGLRVFLFEAVRERMEAAEHQRLAAVRRA